VTLGTDRDRCGIPRVTLNWQITSQDIANAIRVQEIVGRELARAGLGRLYIDLKPGVIPTNLHGGYHHMGTTRMHVDPEKGVVDENSRVHGLTNLFIAGPSVFPTGGHANPILTLIALTLRLSDHITTALKTT
jgi:choline dehydrogenase-like flavoprotein